MALALLMVAGALHFGVATQAADLVCGDGDKEGVEECDDGNLKSGDGCSNVCTVELCGNNAINSNEQCDDGNTSDNDGCNRYCQIEFCGDRVMQTARGEQCDDGNGISADGCSGACKLENTNPPPPPPVIPPPPPVVVPVPPSIPPIIVTGAQQAQKFLGTTEYRKYLTDAELIQLETIVNKLANGRRLTATERMWAEQLYFKLLEAKEKERLLYTDLLRQFIATPISSEVVEEKDLKKWRLVDVYVPVAIDELKRAVDIIRRGELKQQVTFDLTKLRRQAVNIEKHLPDDYASNLETGVQPIKVFATLKTMKEATERYATLHLPTSLEIVREEATNLKLALPIFQREYGLLPEETEPLLTAIEDISLEVTKQDTDRIVGAINRFMGILDRREIFTQADLVALDMETKHAAADAERMVKEFGDGDEVQTPEELKAFLDDMSQALPADDRFAFETGSVEQQRSVLLDLLQSDKRIESLRTIMREEGNTDFDERYQLLHDSIRRAGNGDVTGIGCDDSIDDALRCTNEYLTDLQDAVRNRSFFSRFIGTLQDFFGIGQ